jgi:putative membrane protein
MHHRFQPEPRGHQPHDLAYAGLMLLLIAIIVFGLVVLISWYGRRQGWLHTKQSNLSPLDIAKERYAKGEITKDEFEQIKKDLSK